MNKEVMKMQVNGKKRTSHSEQWNVTRVSMLMMVMVMVMMNQVMALTGPNVCLQKQKYNITKRVKYTAPVSIRTYEWCLSMPPRCSRWTTQMRELTRLENDERIAEIAVCCPGYRLKDFRCIPICPNGKTGSSCSLDCPPNKWGPNCVHECPNCTNQSFCSPVTGECVCKDGWKGERCDQISMLPTTPPSSTMGPLTTTASSPSLTQISTTSSSITKITTSKPFTQTTLAATNRFEVSTSIGTTEIINSYNFTQMPDKRDNFNEVNNSSDIGGNKKGSAMINDTIKINTSQTIQYTPTTMISTIDKMMKTTPKKGVISSVTDIEASTKPTETNTKTTTTRKFTPKEIWIIPAQKGEPSKTNDISHSLRFTTPKTIVVSIIPTSVSTQRRMILTASLARERDILNLSVTKSMSQIGFTTSAPVISTSTLPNNTILETTTSLTKTKPGENKFSRASERMQVDANTNSMRNSTESIIITLSTNKSSNLTTMPPAILKSLNQSISDTNINKSNLEDIATKSKDINFINNTTESYLYSTTELQKSELNETTENPIISKDKTVENLINNTTKLYKTEAYNVTTLFPTNSTTNKDLNKTTIPTTLTTPKLSYEDHTFHILTEPEHITAVINDGGHDKSSVDLVHVLSIAGGVMMAVITVAVIIVMVERCRKTPYDEVDKMDDMGLKVMMDNDIPPPPYVRSIFHTPLPEPPMDEKLHYQPISTLDRKVKQFMRPVVVQSISPIMIENFRGILECHYDHLPRRSHCTDASQCDLRCSLTPSVCTTTELFSSRAPSITSSNFDTLKCEAKFDEIDSTTSEPLYAEIPFWKPPLEHAVEVINTNGEAVTEL